MARDFSAKEAKTLIKKHESYLVSLTQAKGLELLFRDKIKASRRRLCGERSVECPGKKYLWKN